MAGDYPITQVGELASSISDTHKFGKEQLVFLNTSDILHGKFLHRTYSAVKDWPGQAKKSIRKHDILFSEIRPANGRWAYVEEDADDFVVSTKLMVIRAKQDRLFPKFLYQFLTSSEITKWLQHLAESRSGTFPQITFDQVATLELPLPPLAEQKAIAAVLGALDDKIELNRRMNATLEAMARALFQSWFIDFDPVRANMDRNQPSPGLRPSSPKGRGRNAAEGEGAAGLGEGRFALEPATAALFPDCFQESELGHIPKGWRVGVLDALTKFVIGGDWGATEPTDDETVSCYCIRGADIPSLQSGGVGKMPTRFLKPSSVEKRQLADGDLAIEISGGSPTQCTGRPVLASDALLQSLGQPLVASNFCRIVKLNSPALSKFVYLWLRRLYDAGELFQFETGTTGIKNFAFAIFSERYPLVVPDIRVAEAFDRTVSPLFARIQANSKESRSLASLRDTLLPKLLSGALNVQEIRS